MLNMASGINRWKRNNVPVPKNSEEDLLVFGYSCKIFRDDEKASFIDEGKHLIPWMGDENIMIDRYDVRGYLYDLTPFDADPDPPDESDELFQEESMCDEERYMDLCSNMTEELYQEEEMKRLRAALASDGAYHEIEFSYNSIEQSSESSSQVAAKEEIEDEPYAAPSGLTVPKGMLAPSTMKIHAIIEKTAFFVSQQGGQMEFILKMKQSDNPQFAFLQMDNPLHPYYKHMIQELKSGRFKPTPEQKRPPEEHNDGHYLHPSLVSGSAENVPEFTVPSINFQRTGNDSYSLLVRNLKQRIEEDNLRNSPTVADQEREGNDDTSAPYQGTTDAAQCSSLPISSDSEDSSDSSNSSYSVPPADVQTVIDKMAQYVAKNGEDFETIVNSRDDKRFAFLKPGHVYYGYYRWKRDSLKQPVVAEGPKLSIQDKVPRKDSTHSKPAMPKGEIFACASPVRVLNTHQQQLNLTPETSCSPKLEDYPQQSTSSEHCSEQSDAKAKTHSKALKGPISFSLKSKDIEPQTLEKAKKPTLLLDDSEDEENKLIEEVTSPDRRSVSVAETNLPRSRKTDSATLEVEERKRPSSEELEARLAEEKIKDKLAAAARERLAQQKREKQLQLERKLKAASFIKMLKMKKEEEAAKLSSNNGSEQAVGSSTTKSFSNSPVMRHKVCPSPHSLEDSPCRIIPVSSYPSSPPMSPFNDDQAASSSSSSIVLSPKDNANTTEQNQVRTFEASAPLSPEKSLKHKRKHSKEKHKSKSHKSACSKKQKRSKSPSSSRHKLSKSPSKKDKKLPAAYAMPRRSRSRSRSPKRYSSSYSRPSPPPWNRRRP